MTDAMSFLGVKQGEMLTPESFVLNTMTFVFGTWRASPKTPSSEVFHYTWRAPKMRFRGISFSRLETTHLIMRHILLGIKWRRHIISTTKFTADWPRWVHHPRIHNFTRIEVTPGSAVKNHVFALQVLIRYVFNSNCYRKVSWGKSSINGHA